MSYSASDLADHINTALVQLGYTITPVEEDGDGDGEHYWDLGSNGVGSVNSPANAACADAVDDLVKRIQDLQNAAARVIAEAQQGQTTGAIATLKESLDASIPGDIDAFIGGTQPTVVLLPHERQLKKTRSQHANAAFMKALTPSTELAAIVGPSPLPRTEVVKKVWAYIKQNNLQDKRQKRLINADAKLQEVFGKVTVDMFHMTKLISSHLK